MRAGEFFGERAERIGVKLGVSRRQVYEIIRMGEDRQQLSALRVIAKAVDFLACEWAAEPLHVVLDEDLHGRASNGAGPLDRHVRAAGNRHVGAKQNFFCHFERSEAKSRNLLLISAL